MSPRLFFSVILLLITGQSFSQNKEGLRYFRQINQEGDTSYYTLLPEVQITESKAYYLSKLEAYRNYVKTTYELAVFIADLHKEFNDSLQNIGSKKNRRKYLKSEKKRLFDEFTAFVADMSLNEGRVFVKLIYRYSGSTTYDIIKEFQGSAKAFCWQALSRTGGADLKLTYDPAYTDKVLEEVIKEVENGKLKPDPLPSKSKDLSVAQSR